MNGRALIIGGGLAGMTVAKELSKWGWETIIFEGSDHLGGKASATLEDDLWVEHGYHVFPAWYLNVRNLLEEIGAAQNLSIEINKFHLLLPGSWPRYRHFHEFSSIKNAWRNLTSGVLSPDQMALACYFLIDLMSQPLGRDGYLDCVSVNGFLKGRFYASEAVANFAQFTALQASSIDNFELSVMSSQTIGRAWMSHPSPLFHILDGNLQHKFIDPFEDWVRRQGVRIHLNSPVKRLRFRGEAVTGLELEGDRPFACGRNDIFVLTTPPEVTRRFASDELYKAEERYKGPARQRIGDIVDLKTAEMASLHIVFKEKLRNIPREHVNLHGSRYGLSFIDISQHWRELEGYGTVLSFIASNFKVLAPLADDECEELLLREIRRFLPLATRDRIERIYFRPNRDAPLFLNTVGSWRSRPEARTRIRNLYTAGDYCRSEADLTTMESAIISAMNTSRDIIEDYDLGDHPGAMPLGLAPRWLPMAAKLATLPLVAPLGAMNWLSRAFNGLKDVLGDAVTLPAPRRLPSHAPLRIEAAPTLVEKRSA